MPRIERTTSGLTLLAKPAERRRRGARLDGFEGLDRVVVDRRRVAKLDLHDDREDHRPALRLLVQVARDARP